jgi:hypothetical protein
MLAYWGIFKMQLDETARDLYASLKSFGFVNSILDDETGLVIGGHGRVSRRRSCTT